MREAKLPSVRPLYNWNRYYDPKLGRYVTSDPIGLQGGLNSYVYTNRPLNEIDPFGLMGRAPGRGPYSPQEGPGAGLDDIAGNVAEMLGGNRAHTACYLTCIAINRLTCETVTSGFGIVGWAGRGVGAACSSALNRICLPECEKPNQCSGSTAPYLAP